MSTKTFQLGSISTGTLLLKDLIPVFIDTIHQLTLPGVPNASVDWTGADARLFDDGFFTSDDADQTMVEFVEILNELCPPFIYFGTLEGDGADFGFWVDVEAIGESIRHETGSDESVSGDHVLPSENVIIQINDHGNATCYDMERNVIWSAV